MSSQEERGAPHPPLVVVTGPTATGKTAAGIGLAGALGGEIVSADSRQIYRGMDIGTAKPTPEERAAAPHHLIDIRDPDEDFSLAQYVALAREAIAAIGGRGRLPLLVGGTPLYVNAVVEGWRRWSGGWRRSTRPRRRARRATPAASSARSKSSSSPAGRCRRRRARSRRPTASCSWG